MSEVQDTVAAGEVGGSEVAETNAGDNGLVSQVEKELRKFFVEASSISVEVEEGCDDKFSVNIVSERFKGMRLLQRHRLVNGKTGALGALMSSIHALSIKALTPEESSAKKNS